MALLSNATWRVLLAFRVYFLHLCPDPGLESLEPCRQWQDLESILILVKRLRLGRVGVATLNPDGSQVIYIHYANSRCACVCGVMYGKKYVVVCTHSWGEGRIRNQLNFDIYFYFVVLSLGDHMSVDNLRIQVVSKITWLKNQNFVFDSTFLKGKSFYL